MQKKKNSKMKRSLLCIVSAIVLQGVYWGVIYLISVITDDTYETVKSNLSSTPYTVIMLLSVVLLAYGVFILLSSYLNDDGNTNNFHKY